MPALARALSPELRRRLLLGAIRVAPRAFSLGRLGEIFGTDKVDRGHTHHGRTYCDVYADYLEAWRKRRFTLLELGVYGGTSLRMWNAYFPRATVVGLDIDPAAADRAAEFDVAVGSQSDPALLDDVLARHPDIRVVVDDASHLNELTIASFKHLFPLLPSGSLYMIEDLSPHSYGERYSVRSTPEQMEQWSGMNLNVGVRVENDRAVFDAFLLELIAECDLGGTAADWPGERRVAFVHTWPSMLIVGRA